MGAPGTSSGPWTVSLDADIDASDGRAIAMGWCDRDGLASCRLSGPSVPIAECRANARQIAASPDLYDQLTFAVKLLDNLPGFRGTAQLERMHAALAKARGES